MPSPQWNAFGNANQNLNVRGGEVDILYWALQVPQNTPSGIYPISFTVSNLDSGLSTTETISIEVIGEYAIPDPRITLHVDNSIKQEGTPHNALEDCKLEGECVYRLKFGKNLFPEYSKFEIPEVLRKWD